MDPSFFHTDNTGAPHGDAIDHMYPFLDNSSAGSSVLASLLVQYDMVLLRYA